MMRRFFTVSAILFHAIFLFSQGKPEGTARLLIDSAEIGRPVPLAVVSTYPVEYDFLAPDSTFDFSPFILHEIAWTKTLYRDSLLVDSIVYYVKTFEVEALQEISLPLAWARDIDTLKIITEVDTLKINYVTKNIPDSLAAIKLIENTDYYRIEKSFNSAVAVASGIIFIVLSGILWIMFAGRVMKWWRIRKLNKSLAKFREEYEKVIGLGKEKNNLEKALVLWKDFMEKLESYPIRKLTTHEIQKIYPEQSLHSYLLSIDKAIYSRNESDSVDSGLNGLIDFTNKTVESRIEKIKNGTN